MNLRLVLRALLSFVACRAQEPDDPSCQGCPVPERPINTSDELVNMFDPASNFDVRADVEKLAAAVGVNLVFEQFVPLKYRSQVVAGVNYFVRIQVANASVIDVYIFSSFNVSEAPEVRDANFNVTTSDPIDTFPQDFPPADVAELSPEVTCPGCRSKERSPDQALWRLFNASGRQLKKDAEGKAQAMGWNGIFTEFAPVRYADQWVAGHRFFVKVRVTSSPKAFADVLIFHGPWVGNGKPELKAMKLDVDEDSPIDSFHPAEAVELLV
jgi:hypothetical protein